MHLIPTTNFQKFSIKFLLINSHVAIFSVVIYQTALLVAKKNSNSLF